MRTDTTIAIPTFNRAGSLAETLGSLRRVEMPNGLSCEVLVVDNNSSDHTKDVVSNAARSFPMPLRSVVETRLGLCFGRNRALHEATGDHVVFLDDDIRIAPGWLTGYLEAVQTLMADCVVGPVFPVFPDILPPHATRYVLSLIGSDYSRKGDARFLLPESLAHEVPGCNFGVRRSVALTLGGFNNALDRIGSDLLAGGDTEFGIRLAKAGHRVVYEPRCSLEHLIDPSKLEQGYLRRRAKGLGLTSARLRSMHGPRLQTREWLNAGRRTIGLCARWQKYRALGTRVDAFEWELRARVQLTDLVASLSRGSLQTFGAVQRSHTL